MMGTETSFSQNWILDLTYTGTKGTDLDLLRAPQSRSAGHQPARHAGRAANPLCHQFLLRSIGRELDLQRPAGASGASLHAWDNAARDVHVFEVAG